MNDQRSTINDQRSFMLRAFFSESLGDPL